MGPRVVVLGAGISGLSSAVCVQQACPQAQVELVSELFSPDTTSDGSAGFWEPYLLGGENADLTMRVCETTYRYMFDLAQSPIAGVVKAQKLSGYHFYRGIDAASPPWRTFVEAFKELDEEELKRYPNAEAGTFHTSVNMDVPYYMDWLMKRFKHQGGVVRQAKIENIEEVATTCEILINCSSVSSRHLFKDEDVFPTRGQVWKVHAPWIKHFYFMYEKGEETTYVVPGVDSVTVGGTAQVNDWNTHPDPKDGERIWERALRHFPFLRHATPVKMWVGLRPSRKGIRLEPEIINIHGRNFKVIHNYGHGGSGITMHWGCALEVSRMVLEALGTDKTDAQRIISRL